MYYIIYLSAGTEWFTQTELEELLRVCVENNRVNNITGLLLYAEGSFIQMLEGEEEMVMQTYNKISHDQRHKGITLIANGKIKDRAFPDWAMGFKTVGSISNTPFNYFLNPADAGIAPLPITLLKAFIKTAKM